MNIDRQLLQNTVKTVAKEVLIPRFRAVERQYKNDGSIVTEADHLMQHRLSEALLELYPDSILMGEEMSAAEQNALFNNGKPLWCLDPVDGTSNFAAGMPLFCVSLALICDGKITFGLVYDLTRNECFTAVKGEGAWLDDTPLLFEDSLPLKKSLALIDLKRLPSFLQTKIMLDWPFASHRSLGSVAIELCWLAAGRAHVYLHGNQQLWDYSAGLLILMEAGGKASNFDGEAVFNGTISSRSTIAAANSDLFNEWRQSLNLD
jgi:myo-inositol-1(or 4)-monophosphatase